MLSTIRGFHFFHSFYPPQLLNVFTHHIAIIFKNLKGPLCVAAVWWLLNWSSFCRSMDTISRSIHYSYRYRAQNYSWRRYIALQEWSTCVDFWSASLLRVGAISWLGIGFVRWRVTSHFSLALSPHSCLIRSVIRCRLLNLEGILSKLTWRQCQEGFLACPLIWACFRPVPCKSADRTLALFRVFFTCGVLFLYMFLAPWLLMMIDSSFLKLYASPGVNLSTNECTQA